LEELPHVVTAILRGEALKKTADAYNQTRLRPWVT
jgi:hypothetical protein